MEILKFLNIIQLKFNTPDYMIKYIKMLDEGYKLYHSGRKGLIWIKEEKDGNT